jgi:hypothetical protein
MHTPAQRTSRQLFWEEPSVQSHFRAGVSLHSHTMYSEESLGVMAAFVDRVPLLKQAFDSSVDYERSFWTPPLTPKQSHRLESGQIENSLQLPALVSLTDHDDIQASQSLRAFDRFDTCPISTEWTIPYQSTFFHLGVHNLQPATATDIAAEMRCYTAAPDLRLLHRLLAEIHQQPHALVVVNHPLWDEAGIGNPRHEGTLASLIHSFGRYLHAIEVNGLRPLAENQRVLRYGEQLGIPVVAGGDRHGCEPNSLLNLTCGSSVEEFIEEVRYARRSHVVFMPQYRQNLSVRTARTVYDVLRSYPSGPHERRVWTQRVFMRFGEQQHPVPFSELPQSAIARATFGTLNAVLRLLDSRAMQAVGATLFPQEAETIPQLSLRSPGGLKEKSKSAA